MPRSWLIATTALGLCAALSCESSLSLDELLAGKACRIAADGGTECLTGYRCVDRKCVPDEDGVGGSSSGQSGSGGDGGSGAGGEDENGGASGSGGSSTGGTGQGGAGGDAGAGGSTAQGGSDVPDAAVGDGCVPGPLYRDRDGDGYGSDAPEDEEFGCELEGYVSVGGDCHDAVVALNDPADLVHPGQTQHFYVTYPDPRTSDGRSYDFDCSGAEEGDPNNVPPGGSPNCPALALGNCQGTGYLEDSRTGPGVNNLCASETLVVCVQNITCVENYLNVNMTGGDPYGCK